MTMGPFEAQYGAIVGKTTCDAIEAVLTMAPPPPAGGDGQVDQAPLPAKSRTKGCEIKVDVGVIAGARAFCSIDSMTTAARSTPVVD
jgi:hypothetical protein